MGLRIDKGKAEEILREEAARAGERPSPKWERLVRQLSEACEGTSKTHIAFLGTALLARAVRPNVDVFAVKARAKTSGAYSARSLGHGVLVPLAAELGIDLGVTGREPLNNQPYFRIERAVPDAILPLARDRAPVEVLIRILRELAEVTDEAEARAALRAFINVRREYRRTYPTLTRASSSRSLRAFVAMVERFVADESEGGKRAQAVAAGVLDAVFGEDRVDTKRVHDPDRHIPGDVGVRGAGGREQWSRVFEIRDKVVSNEDAILFAQKTAREGVTMAGIVAVAEGQDPLSVSLVTDSARSFGVELSVFRGWGPFLTDAVFWSPRPEEETVSRAVDAIRRRLIQLEVSVQAVSDWDEAAAEAER